MRRGTIRAIAVSVWVLSLVAILVSIPIGIAASNRIEPGQIVVIGDRSSPPMADALAELEREREQGATFRGTSEGFNPGFAILLLFVMLWLSVGVLILWRQPNHWAGWLFLITGAPFALITLSQSLVAYGIKADPGSIPWVGLWAILGEYALYPIALIPLLFLLYPDGHPPTRRWRWAAIGLVGGTAIAILGFLFRPGPFNNWLELGILYGNPLGVDAFAEAGPALITIGAVIALVAAISTVFAVRQRFKRSHGEDRQRMRWIAYVASLAGTFFALQWIVGIGFEFFGPDEDAPIFELFFALTAFTLVVGIPAAYLIAIFRYGLWDLDVVVKKTVQYAIVVAAFIAVAGGVPRRAGPVRRRGRRAPPGDRDRRAAGRRVPLGPTTRAASREPARLREAIHPVRGVVRVRRSGRRLVLDGRRAAQDGAAPRRGDRRAGEPRVAACRRRASTRGVVACGCPGRRRASVRGRSAARRPRRAKPSRSATKASSSARSRSRCRPTTR